MAGMPVSVAAYTSDYLDDINAGGRMLKATEEIAQRLSNGERIALRCW